VSLRLEAQEIIQDENFMLAHLVYRKMKKERERNYPEWRYKRDTEIDQRSGLEKLVDLETNIVEEIISIEKDVRKWMMGTNDHEKDRWMTPYKDEINFIKNKRLWNWIIGEQKNDKNRDQDKWMRPYKSETSSIKDKWMTVKTKIISDDNIVRRKRQADDSNGSYQTRMEFPVMIFVMMTLALISRNRIFSVCCVLMVLMGGAEASTCYPTMFRGMIESLKHSSKVMFGLDKELPPCTLEDWLKNTVPKMICDAYHNIDFGSFKEGEIEKQIGIGLGCSVIICYILYESKEWHDKTSVKLLSAGKDEKPRKKNGELFSNSFIGRNDQNTELRSKAFLKPGCTEIKCIGNIRRLTDVVNMWCRRKEALFWRMRITH
jgi:hypothetical protein